MFAAICDAFNKEFSEAFSPFVVNPEGGIFIESFILKAIVPMPEDRICRKCRLRATIHPAREKASGRFIGRTRRIFVLRRFYAYESLRPGKP